MTPKQVRALRRKLGLSQNRLAITLGTTGDTVSRWERGVKRPSPEMSRRLEAIRSEAAMHKRKTTMSTEAAAVEASAPGTGKVLLERPNRVQCRAALVELGFRFDGPYAREAENYALCAMRSMSLLLGGIIKTEVSLRRGGLPSQIEGWEEFEE